MLGVKGVMVPHVDQSIDNPRAPIFFVVVFFLFVAFSEVKSFN